MRRALSMMHPPSSCSFPGCEDKEQYYYGAGWRCEKHQGLALCAVCVHWVKSAYPGTNFGQCRRYAPRPDWPETDKEDWCGEFVQGAPEDPGLGDRLESYLKP